MFTGTSLGVDVSFSFEPEAGSEFEVVKGEWGYVNTNIFVSGMPSEWKIIWNLRLYTTEDYDLKVEVWNVDDNELIETDTEVYHQPTYLEVGGHKYIYDDFTSYKENEKRLHTL